MKKLLIVMVIFVLALPSVAICQDNVWNNVVEKLKTYLSGHITEKVYLHFDKPFYAVGDTIYFKAYITIGEQHQPSTISGVLNIDLINTAGKVDQYIKLQIDSGTAQGDFALPDSLPPGNYRIRSYTQWMKNEGDFSFFDKIIPVGSAKQKSIIYESASATKATGSKADVQFFPEGGRLVKGIRSKTAFKAINENGRGIFVKGVVVDNNNTEITRFEASHLGMGSFYLLPEQGKTYRAVLKFADGTMQTINLPEAIDKGIVLALDNQLEDTLYAGIFANKAYFEENNGKKLSLLIYSGGETTRIDTKLDNPQIILHLPKASFETGIAQVTLFDEDGRPLNERLAFINNPDAIDMTISGDKTSYQKREKVSLNLSAFKNNRPVAANFSVSVIDEAKVQTNENNETTILTYLLLTSDLNGFIEQPNYYFKDPNYVTSKNLDVLMLTQGYRRFAWKEVLDNRSTPTVWQPEKGLEINGLVKNLFGKPINGGIVTLLPAKGGPLLTTASDDQGIFHFQNLAFADSSRFVLSAVNNKGKNFTQIVYFDDKQEPVLPINRTNEINKSIDSSLVVYVENDIKQQNELVKYGRIKGVLLKNVTVKAKKPENQNPTNNLVSKAFADQVITPDQMAGGGPLSVRIEGALHGVQIARRGVGAGAYATFHGKRMAVILDGLVTDGDLDKITGVDIESIEVLKYASAAAYGPTGANGVLVINTKAANGTSAANIASIGILPIVPKGFYKAREFYSPKYEHTGIAVRQCDLRSTIYWNPYIKPGPDGKAMIDFYNADSTGNYKVIVEGIDSKGSLGRAVYRYKVE